MNKNVLSLFKQRLKSHGGYITAEMYQDAVKELGKDFPVVVKQWTGNRYVVPLKDLYSTVDEEDGIKEVFISSDQYDQIFN